MRDRFDHTLERKLDTKPDSTVVVGPSLGVVTGPGWRREWPASEKARIIVESLTPGANVSEVARRNGLSPGQLFGWRREARELFTHDHGAVCARSTPDTVTSPKTRVAAPTFVPVVVSEKLHRSASSLVSDTAAQCARATETSATETSATETSAPVGTIEIAIGGSVVRVIGRVDADALQSVIEIIRRFACS
jgi:transposase